MNFKKRFLGSLAAFLFSASSFALTINIKEEDNFSTAQSQRLKQVVAVLNQVINSPELKDQIINFTYQGKKQFVQNNGLSNLQVYENLMSAAEVYPLETSANNQADISLSMYYPPWYRRNSSAVAFTSESDPYINIYASYYNSASITDLSDTVFHEWIHKLGFDHDFKITARRPYSVPYAVGGMVYELVKKYLGK